MVIPLLWCFISYLFPTSVFLNNWPWSGLSRYICFLSSMIAALSLPSSFTRRTFSRWTAVSILSLLLSIHACIQTVYFKCHAVLNTDHPSSALRYSPVQPVYICLWLQHALNCKQFSRFPVHDLKFFFCPINNTLARGYVRTHGTLSYFWYLFNFKS